jgi:hypothetical protein
MIRSVPAQAIEAPQTIRKKIRFDKARARWMIASSQVDPTPDKTSQFLVYSF